MKTKYKSIFLLLFVVILLPFTLVYSSNQEKTISAWLAFWDTKNSIENLKSNFSDKIKEINLFFYAFDKDGNIINTAKEQTEFKQLITILKQIGTKIIPTITNDIIYSKTERKLKDSEIISRILNDTDLRQRHIQQIIKIIKEINADGIDIDYENIYIKDNDIFTWFIRELSILLHSLNKTLTVTVQQKTKNHQRSGAGVIDWHEISKYADKITIMCYNYSSKITEPGPICPYFWLKDIIKFAKSQIPIEKICIALALHGYDWSSDGINSLNFKQAKSTIDEYNIRLKWDKKSRTPYFEYYKNGIRHAVWFENQESISEKIKIIKKFKIKQIALWHLGILDPSLTDSLNLTP